METITELFFILTILATGAFLAATPWLMPQNECFAVTIPEGQHNDARFVAFRKRYALVTGFVTVLSALSFALGLIWLYPATDASNAFAFAWLLIICIFVPIAVSFALMLHFRRRVQAIKQAEGWSAPHPQAAAVVAETDMPKPISLWWNLLYVPVILGTAGLTFMLYPSMPEQIPMHIGMNGQVTNLVDKSIPTALFPVFVQIFLALVMTISHWSIIHSKRSTGVDAPVTSAVAYGLFARAESVFLLVSGLAISLVLGITFELSSAGIITLSVTLIPILFVAALVIMGAIVLNAVYGQAGSKLFRHMEKAQRNGATSLYADDDHYWKLGIFYFNPTDASVFLPKRFGIGWTINLARAGAWAFIGGIVVLLIAFTIAMSQFAG